MEDRSREILRTILKRAMEQGREGRVLEFQKRLKSAQEMPVEHRQILTEIALFGRSLPKSPFQMSLTVH